MAADRNYKIVPLDAQDKTLAQRAQELRGYLASNVEVKTIDLELDKAAVFQGYLDTLDELLAGGRP